ncbi:MAG: hypothetical protein KVP17_001772 [Porospora cf. gigantea B]|uniref:uncharacterized protein n=1 Tax=Porospora cf. gigantea B TaxID=2853592 RepID=UPI0035719986|nr:MAG: hypothetical protein KVP17_001772 [Porospora cf. gigantea B]
MTKYCRAEPNSNCAKAKANDVRSSFKNMVELCNVVKGMSIGDCKQYLDDVLNKRRCVPYFHFNGGIGRTAQAKEWNASQGRWPEKSVRNLKKVLDNAVNNAKVKELDTDTMYIYHAFANRARKGRRRKYRAHGRINPWMSNPCHVELILAPLNDEVKPVENAEQVPLTKWALQKEMLRVGGGIGVEL